MVPKGGLEPSGFPTTPASRGELGRKVVYSPITETESMKKFRTYIYFLKGRKSRHQFH
jgi:hypothetical protein